MKQSVARIASRELVPLHGIRAVAPLKHEDQRLEQRLGLALHGIRAVAPLKLVLAPGTVHAHLLSTAFVPWPH